MNHSLLNGDTSMHNLTMIPIACGYIIFICLALYIFLIIYAYSKDIINNDSIPKNTIIADMIFIIYILFLGLALFNEGINSSIYHTYKFEIRFLEGLSPLIYYGVRKNLYIMKKYHKYLSNNNKL